MHFQLFEHLPVLYGATQGTLGKLLLNQHEIKCLEMALYFLNEQRNKRPSDISFHQLQLHQVQHLSLWLEAANLKFNHYLNETKTSIEHTITSLEDIKWWILGLQAGTTLQTMLSIAKDMANYERDMAMMDAKNALDYSHAETKFHYHVYHFYVEYSEAASYKDGLLYKLQHVLDD